MKHTMRTAEAAAYLGLAPSTLSTMRSRGRGPRYIKPAGRAVRYRKADLDEYLAALSHLSTAQQMAAASSPPEPTVALAVQQREMLASVPSDARSNALRERAWQHLLDADANVRYYKAEVERAASHHKMVAWLLLLASSSAVLSLVSGTPWSVFLSAAAAALSAFNIVGSPKEAAHELGSVFSEWVAIEQGWRDVWDRIEDGGGRALVEPQMQPLKEREQRAAKAGSRHKLRKDAFKKAQDEVAAARGLTPWENG